MRIAFLINSYETEKAGYTTTRLGLAAHRRGHDVRYLTVEDFMCASDETLRVRVRAPGGTYKTHKTFHEGVCGAASTTEVIPVEDLDVIMLRNDPADDATDRPWAQSAGIVFGGMAAQRGVLVVNNPEGLAKAVNKVYFQRFPEAARPKTLITRHEDDINRFLDQHGGDAVLKPFQGSGGEGVFVIRGDDRANLNQIVESVSRNGYIVCQEYLADAVGTDIRMFLINGKPLERDGAYAAFRRRSSGEDIRSNISAGGKIEAAEITDLELKLAEMVRPQLVADGMFMVGLDIAGTHLLEVNVFSPGGLGSIIKVTGVDFTGDVIEALERKVAARASYKQQFTNVALATL